jgi:ribose transport system substrate-binding protein
VDYNKVGSVIIFGYSSNDTILHAIDRGVITASLAIDVPQIGSDSTACLDDFYSSGFANEYVSIDVKTIDSSNAAQYLIADTGSSDTAATGGKSERQ